MKSWVDIEECGEIDVFGGPVAVGAQELLNFGEEVLENWISAKDIEPTHDKVEGFRLLALHRQGAKGDPSFNACRETCRELVYHYNLITQEPNHASSTQRLRMMRMIAEHIWLFVRGKAESANLGEFCCSSRDIRRGETQQ